MCKHSEAFTIREIDTLIKQIESITRITPVNFAPVDDTMFLTPIDYNMRTYPFPMPVPASVLASSNEYKSTRRTAGPRSNANASRRRKTGPRTPTPTSSDTESNAESKEPPKSWQCDMAWRKMNRFIAGESDRLGVTVDMWPLTRMYQAQNQGMKPKSIFQDVQAFMGDVQCKKAFSNQYTAVHQYSIKQDRYWTLMPTDQWLPADRKAWTDLFPFLLKWMVGRKLIRMMLEQSTHPILQWMHVPPREIPPDVFAVYSDPHNMQYLWVFDQETKQMLTFFPDKTQKAEFQKAWVEIPSSGKPLDAGPPIF